MKLTCLRFLSTFILLLCIKIGVKAQDGQKINASFSNISFNEFVSQVEKTTNYFFYYNPVETDSLTINTTAANIPLSALLQKIFAGSEFQYAIDQDNNVFISKRFAVRTNLPPDYFNKNGKASDTSIYAAIPDYNQVAKPAISQTDNNKLVVIGERVGSNKNGKAIISGYIRDAKNGEAIVGATVAADSSAASTTTDQFGYYTLTLPVGYHIIQVSGAGMKDVTRRIQLYSDGSLNALLEDQVISLRAVVVHADKNSNLGSTLMGVNRLSSATIKKIPSLLGETDVLRAVLTLPGVVSVGEGSTGFNVRGGAADQNLILFSDATIYNPAHLFGFFTAFNPDIVKNVELYKSGIPEKYGGRLSSVLEVTAKEGNNKKMQGTAGLGLMTSKLAIEGPLGSEKTTFVLGGRTTYSNWLLKQVPKASYRNSEASFYDGNLHINHAINSKNSLHFTAYTSGDKFRLNSDTSFQFGNKNINLKWKHIFNNRFYGLVLLGFDQYQYTITGNEQLITGYQMKFGIEQKNFRTDFVFTPNNKHQLNFGINSIYYKMEPGSYKPKGGQSLVTPDVLQKEQAIESAVYVGDRYNINEKLSVNAGLRFSYYNFLGPREVNNYVQGVPKETSTIIDTTSFGSGKIIKTYYTPEYRLSARYILGDSSSVKISFNSLRQYIHMISNTTTMSPTDIWKLSDSYIKPQDGYQVSLGYYRNFKSNTIETSLEVYFKRIKNYLDYKSGAELNINHHLETDVLSTRGKAYGAELLIKKNLGKLNGWISYAYSRTLLQMNDSLAGEVINGGQYYPANFDKPHILNFIGNYRFLHKLSASLNIVYNSGRPITLPIALFNVGGAQGVYYSERNQYRIPDYFRVDFSVNLDGNHKLKQKTHNSWTVGVYNVLGRDNPYSVYFVQESGKIKGYQLSIFASQIPFISYNIRF